MKILLPSINLKRTGGVTNFIRLLSDKFLDKEIEVIHFEIGKSINPKYRFFLPFILIYQFISFRRIVKRVNPDVVFLHPSLKWNAILRDFFFQEISSKFKIPVALFIHGWDEKVEVKFSKGSFLKDFFLDNFKKSSAIFVLSEKFKKSLVELGISPSKIKLSSPMIKHSDYLSSPKIATDSSILLYCGNIVREKGIFLFLDSIAKIKREFPHVKAIFLGGGRDINILKRKTIDMDLSQNVIITGYVSNNLKKEIFKKSHIFVFPTFYGEGFPAVVIEAMATGLPIVCSRKAALKEIINNNQNGFLLSNPIKPSEISEKVIHLIKNSELSLLISESNLSESLKYDIDSVCSNIKNVLKNLNTGNSYE